MTISEIPVLTSDYKLAWNIIKMTSDEKVFNSKVFRLVETDDFDIKNILI